MFAEQRQLMRESNSEDSSQHENGRITWRPSKQLASPMVNRMICSRCFTVVYLVAHTHTVNELIAGLPNDIEKRCYPWTIIVSDIIANLRLLATNCKIPVSVLSPSQWKSSRIVCGNLREVTTNLCVFTSAGDDYR